MLIAALVLFATAALLGAYMLTFALCSAIVILLGAELNAEIEHQTAEDTTEGGKKPLGARDAKMADTVGAAKS